LDNFLFFGLLILVFIGLPIGFGILLYFIPKKLGYPKTGKYLTIIYVLLVSAFVLLTVFEDKLFTNDNAKALIEEQQILLDDKFEITENKSASAIGDYYHTFTLKISDNDKRNAISKIKSANNFKPKNIEIDDLLSQRTSDRYFGKKVIQNYETENSFVREYFEPSGKKGYAPTFRRISISKSENLLKFEDIDD
jgi:hypothetical protein